MRKTIPDFVALCTRIAVEHGFTDNDIPTDCALIHSEVSELLEAHREGAAPDDFMFRPLLGKAGPPKPIGIPAELADIVIRCFHFAGRHGIDLERAIIEKCAYNESRPHKHGKAY